MTRHPARRIRFRLIGLPKSRFQQKMDGKCQSALLDSEPWSVFGVNNGVVNKLIHPRSQSGSRESI